MQIIQLTSDSKYSRQSADNHQRFISSSISTATFCLPFRYSHLSITSYKMQAHSIRQYIFALICILNICAARIVVTAAVVTNIRSSSSSSSNSNSAINSSSNNNRNDNASRAGRSSSSSSGVVENNGSSMHQQSTERVQQCREGCFEKFATKEILCQQNSECLTCWDECAKPPPPKINKSIRETWSLHTVSMLQQDSLVLVDVAWAPLSTPNQCLVTWEVSGGGLMGNLLTESYNVQLSLWPDTKYRVQVTCKNKLTGIMSRSLPLAIDTAEAAADTSLGDLTTEKKQQQQQETQQQTKQLQTFTFTTTTTSTNSPIKSPSPGKTSTHNHHNDQDYLDNFYINHKDLHIKANQIDDISYDDLVNAGLKPDLMGMQRYHHDFEFNNDDISAIEPIDKSDWNIISISAMSDMRKPVMFGLIAGTLLLSLILFVYICILREQRLSADKAALVVDEEDTANSIVVSLPPTTSALPSTSASTTLVGSINVRCMRPQKDETFNNSVICPSNTLKV